MNTINSNDLQILSDYRFIENGRNKQNNHLLALKWVKTDSGWKQQLIQINRQDATCWHLFLSLFNLGKLKYTTISLDKICTYLSQYQWDEIKLRVIQDSTSSDYKGFETVCHLANRRFWHPLFAAVTCMIQSDFNSHYWNLAMQGRCLYSIYRNSLKYAKQVELRFKDTKASVPLYQRLTMVDMVRIEVGFAWERIPSGERKVPDYFRSPQSPYYYTGPIRR